MVIRITKLNKTILFAGLLFSSLAWGQTTLPDGVFSPGAVQYPLKITPTMKKQGTYGISVVTGVPLTNPDRSGNQTASTVRMFEIWPDGSVKELGPAHSPQADVREKGGGRFSHWFSAPTSLTYILLSSSDATDPRTNGRKYLAVQPDDSPVTDSAGAYIDTQSNTVKYYLQTPDSANRSVVISNPSSSSYAFNLAFNQNGFLQSSAELKQEIQNKIPEFANEPTERKIWNFTRRNHIWQLPYTAARWIHHPLLMFNSVGWGLCDDAAASLMLTASLFGINGRVWGLHGHVVPELFTNNSWHMYDPTDQTYFLDASGTGNVVSVSDLIANHDLITTPNNLSPWTPFASKLIVAGTENYVIPVNYYANLYSVDDVVSNWYKTAEVTEIPLVFDLPPAGSVEVGAHSPLDVPTTLNGSLMSTQPAYSSVKVSLPEGASGDLQVFLIPYKIKGNGSVTLRFQDNTVKTYEITPTSNWNQASAADRNSYIKSISYTAGTGGLVVHYLANKIRSSVKAFNSVILKPSSASSTVTNPLRVTFNVTP